MYKIIVDVAKVMGKCHTGFRKGDRIVVNRPRIDMKQTNKICIYALQSLIPFIVVMSSEIMQTEDPFRKKGDAMLEITHIRCPDPGKCYAGGSGSVIFRIIREKL